MKSLNIPYQPRIDQLRWFAAILVFMFHFYLEYRGAGGAELNSRWTALITQGHTGVGLFFTLSGFLFMQIALVQERIVYRDFVRNRILRILPLFLTIFLVATSIGRDNFQPQDLLYLFATNLGHAPTSGTVITGAAWTISLEFLFYLVFPFLARFAIERGPRHLVELLVLMGFFKLAAYTVNENSTLMYFSTFVGRFDQFLIGMLAAMLYGRHQAWLQRHAPWLVLAAAILVAFDTGMLQRLAPFGVAPKSSYWIFWSMVESTGWAMFIMAWAALRLRLPGVVERVLCHGGKISFSFYLLHMASLHLIFQRLGPWRPTGHAWTDTALMFAMTYGATWALATISYNAIEEPFLRMRRRYGQETVPNHQHSDKVLK